MADAASSAPPPAELEPSAVSAEIIASLASSLAPPAVLGAAQASASASVAGPADPPALPAEEGPAQAAAAQAAAKKGRGAGKRLTDRERLAILEELDRGAGVSNAEIARRYGITRAAVQKLKAKGAEVRARYRHGSVGLRDARKRGSHSVSVPFERELFEWVRGLKARKVPVPPSLVKEKAKLLVPKYELGAFQASNGWYYNFCKRFSLTSGVLVEDKADALLPSSGEQIAGGSGASSAAPLLAPPVAVAAAAASPAAEELSASDRILRLLETQAALIDRQTRASEQQAETMKKLLEFLVAGQADAPSANI